MNNIKKTWLLFLLLAAISVSGYAQSYADKAKNFLKQERKDSTATPFAASPKVTEVKVVEEKGTDKASPPEVPIPEKPLVTGVSKNDSLLNVAYTNAMTDYYNYKKFGYDHRTRVFNWQLTSSKLIFVVVVFLVVCGVAFAGVQFFYAYHKGGSAKAFETDTTIKASSTGIEVSSPVLGLLILIVSLLFFWLYLTFVYPVVDTF